VILLPQEQPTLNQLPPTANAAEIKTTRMLSAPALEVGHGGRPSSSSSTSRASPNYSDSQLTGVKRTEGAIASPALPSNRHRLGMMLSTGVTGTAVFPSRHWTLLNFDRPLPGTSPPIASGYLRTLSLELVPDYTAAAASQRRERASEMAKKRIDHDFRGQDIEVVSVTRPKRL
jgi:hypothetical protein